LIKSYGINIMPQSHLESFCLSWSPFVEYDEADPESRKKEHSNHVVICNSYAWLQYAIRSISESLGIQEVANQIVLLYTYVRDIDSEAHKLIMFDNLNAIFEATSALRADWGGQIINLVYQKLASLMATDSDYWLQRAKGIYYISNDESELRVAIAYCEKGIKEKDKRASINAKLTKANLHGKLCFVTDYASDDDLSSAVLAYSDAINDYPTNPTYIDELLKKSRHRRDI